MPLDFLSEVTPVHSILTSLTYYVTTNYSSVLGPHRFSFFPCTFQNEKKIFLHSQSETTKLTYCIITVSLVFLTLNKPPFSQFLKLIYDMMSYLDCLFLCPKATSWVLISCTVYIKISEIIIRGLSVLHTIILFQNFLKEGKLNLLTVSLMVLLWSLYLPL